MTALLLRLRCALVLFVALAGAARASAADPSAGATAKKPQPRITVGKDTTYITEPLDKDGYVDYLAAINQMASEGVTPENNAAVPMLKAFGPKDIAAPIRKQYFAMLGMMQLPDEGEYFQTFSEYLPSTLQVELRGLELKEFDVSCRPWEASRHPRLASWLADEDGPLGCIVDASQRPRRYDPNLCVLKQDLLIMAANPSHIWHWEAAHAFRARAMLRLGEGNVESAWHDLLVCHRLARLIGQGVIVTNASTAMRVERIACAGDAMFLGNVALSAAQARRMHEDLSSLAPLPCMADHVNLGARLEYLNSVQEAVRRGPDFFGNQEGLPKLTRSVAYNLTDWDAVMRDGNRWYDRYVDAMKQPTYAARAAAIRTLQAEVDAFSKPGQRVAPKSSDEGIMDAMRRGATIGMTRVFVGMFLKGLDFPALHADQGNAALTVTKTGFALAAYRAEQGHYPAKLSELVPAYTAQVPLDLYSDKELIYRRTADGYVLYSVGPNLQDDGGRGREEHTDGAAYDDIVLRIPPPPPKSDP